MNEKKEIKVPKCPKCGNPLESVLETNITADLEWAEDCYFLTEYDYAKSKYCCCNCGKVLPKEIVKFIDDNWC